MNITILRRMRVTGWKLHASQGQGTTSCVYQQAFDAQAGHHQHHPMYYIDLRRHATLSFLLFERLMRWRMGVDGRSALYKQKVLRVCAIKAVWFGEVKGDSQD
jgi:hypothetical protein